MLPTTLMEQLLDGCLLGVEHQSSHVIVILGRRISLHVMMTRTEVVTSLIPKTDITLRCGMRSIKDAECLLVYRLDPTTNPGHICSSLSSFLS